MNQNSPKIIPITITAPYDIKHPIFEITIKMEEVRLGYAFAS